jgi:hypothetical protein
MALAVKEAPPILPPITPIVVQKYHRVAPIGALARYNLRLDHIAIPREVRRIWGSLIDTFNTFSPCEKPLAKINHF